jgi:flagella basal body P-ring formation protein FlgA
MRMHHFRSILLVLLAVPLCGLVVSPDAGRASEPFTSEAWRIRFLESAIVRGEIVRLGEVAVPLGNMPPGMWEELAQRELWPSPQEGGKPVNMTRPRLQEAVMRTMKDLAPFCLFPGSMALQRGGVVIGKEAVQRLVEQQLGPYLHGLPGEIALKDFRLPQQIFLEHAGQETVLELPKKLTAGRISLRLLVREMDGTVKQKLTGSVFADCWAEVPCATEIMNRDDLLDHTKITFRRMNLAVLRSAPWDGRGGPWRVTRPLLADQVIYATDVEHIPTVRKGSIVTLIYEGKTVRLSLQAEALSDGSAGESIPVRNMQSRKEVYGLIRDSSTVTVSAMP